MDSVGLASTPSKSTCLGCFNLAEDIDIAGERFVNVAEVIRAAERGCSGCKIFHWVLGPYMEQLKGKTHEVQLMFSPPGIQRLLFFHGGIHPVDNVASVELMTLPQTPATVSHAAVRSFCPWRLLEPLSPISGYTGSANAINRARSWLDECLNEHEDCRHTSNSHLPTRVLRIDGPNMVKLYNPKNEVADYACLSYCWGSRPFLQTTISTLERHLNKIPWGKLPKTLQDAVTFTYGLGLKFLWIDSLCIIQDSIDDWRHEGSKMSQIYANSHITLSATKSADAYEGCFVTSEKRHISRFMSVQNGSNETYQLHCREPLGRSKAPLHLRGWAFQERMLSKRIVHFMEQELAWECVTGRTCECSSRHDEVVLVPSSMLRGNKTLGERFCIGQIQELWNSIVENYTKTSLTYPDDVFPALQGLVKWFPPSMGNYLAGHWETTLAHSLCWSVPQDGRRPRHSAGPREWRAPTWSWASTLCAVAWPPPLIGPFSTCVTILSANTVPKGTDTSGQLSYGEIVLRGKCLPGIISFEKSPHPWYSDFSSQKLFLDDESIHKTHNGIPPEPWYCYPAWDYTLGGEGDTQVLAMKVRACEEWSMHDWLVMKAIDSRNKVYQRLGLLTVGDYDRHVRDPSHQSLEQLDALYSTAAEEMEVTLI